MLSVTLAGSLQQTHRRPMVTFPTTQTQITVYNTQPTYSYLHRPMVTSPATEDSMAGLDMAICGLTTTQLQLLYDNAKDGLTTDI